MERLPTSTRAAILRCLIEGNSIASTTRITGAAKNTIQALRRSAGRACEAYHQKVTGDQWTTKDVVEMIDEYEQEQEEAAYEEAFSKLAPVRKTPKTYAPRKPLTPWYLDKDSGGPNPPADERKEGIAYEE